MFEDNLDLCDWGINAEDFVTKTIVNGVNALLLLAPLRVSIWIGIGEGIERNTDTYVSYSHGSLSAVAPPDLMKGSVSTKLGAFTSLFYLQ